MSPFDLEKFSSLLDTSEKRLERTEFGFERYLEPEIEWDLPLIILKGPRGSGKTTLLLQRAERLKKQRKRAVYVSLDHPHFESLRLYDFAEALVKEGYAFLFVDEVHKYPFWSKDLKAIYDSLPDLKVVASGSSILNLIHGEADLSRRAASYKLPGLSFREYLQFKGVLNHKAVPLENILKSHRNISEKISSEITVLQHFRAYLKHGYYPFFMESVSQYPDRLLRTINTVFENDIPAFENVDYQTVRNLKKMLYYISQSVPSTPNITELAGKVGTSRPNLLRMLDFMERGDVILQLRSAAKSVSKMAKPEKIYLQNTNMSYVYQSQKPDVGQMRETFFFNQLSVKHKVTAPRYGDFMIDATYVFEIGGPSKMQDQILGVPHGFVAADGIAQSSANRIPLWLFGFLY